jgi:hypothetical protein
MVLARALIRAGNWKRVDEVKAAISKRKREDTRGAIRAIDIDAAIRRGEWRLAERLMPETLKTEDERELALDILELKSVDTTVMLAERQEAKADAERRRSRRGDRIRRPPMDRDLYE